MRNETLHRLAQSEATDTADIASQSATRSTPNSMHAYPAKTRPRRSTRCALRLRPLRKPRLHHLYAPRADRMETRVETTPGSKAQQTPTAEGPEPLESVA